MERGGREIEVPTRREVESETHSHMSREQPLLVLVHGPQEGESTVPQAAKDTLSGGWSCHQSTCRSHLIQHRRTNHWRVGRTHKPQHTPAQHARSKKGGKSKLHQGGPIGIQQRGWIQKLSKQPKPNLSQTPHKRGRSERQDRRTGRGRGGKRDTEPKKLPEERA